MSNYNLLEQLKSLPCIKYWQEFYSINYANQQLVSDSKLVEMQSNLH